MRRLAAIAVLIGATAAPLNGQMPGGIKIPSLGGGMSTGSGLNGLSDSQLGSGVKDALSVGTEKAVHAVDHPGGYLDNAAIKILLPSKLKPLESTLRAAGQGPKIDNFVASMNHAAESAAPEAEHIFGDAVKSMTVEDARGLITGGDTSITDYFKKKTSAELTAAFKPHVETAMQANGVTQQFQALSAQLPSMPAVGGFGGLGGAKSGGGFDITNYVVEKALDGLFYMLAQQEKEIRTNPAARTTGLLKQVFGK